MQRNRPGTKEPVSYNKLIITLTITTIETIIQSAQIDSMDFILYSNDKISKKNRIYLIGKHQILRILTVRLLFKSIFRLKLGIMRRLRS